MKRTSIFSIVSLLVDIFISSTPTFAQSFQPILTHSSANVFIEGDVFYVLGGFSSETRKPVSQLISIDLSASWNTSHPTFKSISGSPMAGLAPASLTKDNTALVALSSEGQHIFDLATQNWTTAAATSNNPSSFKLSSSLGAVTDPESGLIFIPNGAINDTHSSISTEIAQNGTTFLLGLNPSTNKYFLNDIPFAIQMLTHFSVAWTASLKKLLLFGGDLTSGSIFSNELYSFDAQEGWKQLTTTGDIPSPRSGACFVPAYHGSKMILFGGLSKSSNKSTTPNTPQSDIYILDVTTLVWTRELGAVPSDARFFHSCAVSYDHLIVWGGINQVTNKPNTTTPPLFSSTLVYNLNQSIWSDTYNISNSTPMKFYAENLDVPKTNTSSYDSSPPSESSSTDPQLVLKIVIGCCVATIVFGILYYVVIYKYFLDPLDSDKPLIERIRFRAVRRAMIRAERRANDSIAMTSQELRENYNIPKDVVRTKSKLNNVVTIDDSDDDMDHISISHSPRSHHSPRSPRSPRNPHSPHSPHIDINHGRLHNYDSHSNHSNQSLNDFDSNMADICTKSTIEPRNPAAIRTRDLMDMNDFSGNIERITSELNEIIHIEANKPLYITPPPRTIPSRRNNY
ncbi:hypothetical protein BGZ76_001363 [Entomortierella beljakovae]|nr:hypothetical protein BGZ76_001363 [Entomortierella beljakovae]